jgi:hypothetical protein
LFRTTRNTELQLENLLMIKTSNLEFSILLGYCTITGCLVPSVFGQLGGPIFKGKMSNEDWTFHSEDGTVTLSCNIRHQSPTDVEQYPKRWKNSTALLQKPKHPHIMTSH